MDLVIYTLRSIAYVIAEPFLMVTLFILGLVLFKKNRRVTAMQRMITVSYTHLEHLQLLGWL